MEKALTEIEEISATEENYVQVVTVQGIGTMISTTMVPAIGSLNWFG